MDRRLRRPPQAGARRHEALPSEDAERAKAEVVSLKEKLKALKAVARTTRRSKYSRSRYGNTRKQPAKLKRRHAIDAAVFDLKAVNPNAVIKIDTRTPGEVIQSIEDQGKIVAQALNTLRELLKTSSSPKLVAPNDESDRGNWRDDKGRAHGWGTSQQN